jgi:pre-rRNA-processing protein TSR3
MTYPTLIIRHRRENLKKCSLTGLETRPDMLFYTYPEDIGALPSLENHLLLAIDGEPLEKSDKGLLLIDSTWRLSEKILNHAELRPKFEKMPRRRLPEGFKTAYPRRQEDCLDPEAGLASIEALFVALLVAGHSTTGLLDHYYWKEGFLQKNAHLIDFYK